MYTQTCRRSTRKYSSGHCSNLLAGYKRLCHHNQLKHLKDEINVGLGKKKNFLESTSLKKTRRNFFLPGMRGPSSGRFKGLEEDSTLELDFINRLKVMPRVQKTQRAERKRERGRLPQDTPGRGECINEKSLMSLALSYGRKGEKREQKERKKKPRSFPWRASPSQKKDALYNEHF